MPWLRWQRHAPFPAKFRKKADLKKGRHSAVPCPWPKNIQARTTGPPFAMIKNEPELHVRRFLQKLRSSGISSLVENSPRRLWRMEWFLWPKRILTLYMLWIRKMATVFGPLSPVQELIRHRQSNAGKSFLAAPMAGFTIFEPTMANWHGSIASLRWIAERWLLNNWNRSGLFTEVC